ncbi:MAG TPA: ABC transporter ATP-binding protein [Candidatus Saccharimonadales bacterium]|jgi:peptide/nickel transport system ATP-binding protein|nr:ABC transporter ATP-binding protein [Candidatus Saccharimonadales bacterium]
MQPLLQVRNLEVCYALDDRRQSIAVDGLSFDITSGEAVGVLGESGCGKTTLGLSLLRLLPKAASVLRGAVVFQGKDLLTLAECDLRRVRGAGISMVYQEPGMALNPVIRVGDQIAEVLRAHESMSWARAREEACALLAQVGLATVDRIDMAYPHQLSGGQKQRVVIAQAIACHPALIIADEPTTALDAVTQMEILTLLKGFQERLRLAFLLISHNPDDLDHFADRILVMYAGQVVEEGPARDVLQSPLHPYTRGLLRSRPANGPDRNRKRFLEVIPGEPPDLGDMPEGCAFAARCPDGRSLCRTRKPEEVWPEAVRRVRCVNYAH